METVKNQKCVLCFTVTITLLAALFVFANAGLTQFNADFKGNPTSGYAPLQVTFTDQSQGIIFSWVWSFPGGSPSSAQGQGPHVGTYNNPGTFNVTLTIRGPLVGPPLSDTETKSGYINGTFTLSTLIPHTANLGDGFLRFRFSTDPNVPYAESAINGEVEDYTAEFISIFDSSVGDSLALVALYDSTDGPNWTDNTNWLTGPLADWFGIWVHSGRVLGVFLPHNNLVGTIPSEIGNLTNLEILILDRNELTGSIPSEIGILTNLEYLYLDGNALTGSIPSEIGNLNNLYSLQLGSNQIDGPIPVEIGNMTNLEALLLQDNLLSGAIPDTIGNLMNLRTLLLSHNDLTGSIPVEIGNLTNLEYLILSHNSLTGTIPTEIYNLPNLIVLNLHTNQLNGTIPSQISNLLSIELIHLKGNQFSGQLPQEIGSLITLQALFLCDNDFNGPIPLTFSNLVNLHSLGIANNDFTDLPDLSGIASMNYLYMEGNQFTFEHIEPYVGMNLNEFTYSSQDSVGTEQTFNVVSGANVQFSVNVGGTANQYQWMQNNVDVPGATDNDYTIDPADSTDAGIYVCKITNTIATDLTLYSRSIHVIVDGYTGIEYESIATLADRFSLLQNHPNPFNTETTIGYQLPREARVSMLIYDMQGHEVRRLVHGTESAGHHTVQWNGRDEKGRMVASGMYFYMLEVKANDGGKRSFVDVRKMVFMR